MNEVGELLWVSSTGIDGGSPRSSNLMPPRLELVSTNVMPGARRVTRQTPRILYAQHQCKEREMVEAGQKCIQPGQKEYDDHPCCGKSKIKYSDCWEQKEKQSE